MPIIGDIIAVARELRDLKSGFSKAKKEQRGRIADYFAAISDCLEGTYESLKVNEVPHKRCAELETLARALPATLKGTVDPDKAQELSAQLLRSHEVEGLWEEFQTNPRVREELPTIAEAAGVFSGLATSVRAGLTL